MGVPRHRIFKVRLCMFFTNMVEHAHVYLMVLLVGCLVLLVSPVNLSADSHFSHNITTIATAHY